MSWEDMIATFAGPVAAVLAGFWFGLHLLNNLSRAGQPDRRIRGTIRAWVHFRRGMSRGFRRR